MWCACCLVRGACCGVRAVWCMWCVLCVVGGRARYTSAYVQALLLRSGPIRLLADFLAKFEMAAEGIGALC